MIIDTAESVHANGIDIHYRDLGRGQPLVLLHGGLVDSSDVFADTPVSYAPFMKVLSRQCRVIAPDTRSAGLTRHPGGPISESLLSDDVAALIAAVGLDRPVLAGFSEGGLTALLVGIRHPGAVRAIICDAGYDMLNPDAPAFEMLRQLLGGAETDEIDPRQVERALSQDPHTAKVVTRMKAQLSKTQGPDAWPTYLRLTLERWSHWPGYGYADLSAIDVPTLVMVGDRDHFCSVEEAVTAYRQLNSGELAILPATGHEMTSAKIDQMTTFIATVPQ